MTKPGAAKLANIRIRPVHRILGTILLLFTFYFAATGLTIQAIDLRAIFSHAPATDPEMMEIREGIYGPSNFVMIEPRDYASSPLPQDFDFNSSLTTVLKSTQATLDDAMPLKSLEFRVIDGKPILLVQAGDRVSRFDAVTGSLLAGHAIPATPRSAASLHHLIKNWHSLFVIGHMTAWLNTVVGIGLFVMIVTGLLLYFQLLRVRRRAGLNALFWSTGGWWRSFHRSVSLVAAVFLMVVAVTGVLLSIDSFSLGIYQATHKGTGLYSRFPIGVIADYSSPLSDAALQGMLTTTLSAYRATYGARPIEALRLRYFSGMPQGVIVTGGKNVTQLVFNASTGKPASMTETGYPTTAYPFGWEEHELVKQIHRGDAFGITGRIMDFFAGLSLVFLSASGIYMYVDLLRRRRRGGRKQLFWT